eukprot:scaffold1160_cov120-Skeletonema_menzelii.AAC.5
MPPRKRKAIEEAQVEEVVPPLPAAEEEEDIQVPALPDDIPMPPIESPQQDMGALAAAAAAAVAVSQPPPPNNMTDAQLAVAATTASSASAAAVVSTAGDPSVSRKEKSLAVLCLNFMAVARESPFNADGMKIIEIQQIAERLGAKRRRIYDIINILESVNIVSRVKKNTYQWNGMDKLPTIFAVMQKEGLEEMAAKEAEAAAAAGVVKSEEKPEGVVAGQVENIGGKKTKGVARTCKKFFQIFLTTGQTHVAVSDAANIIEGPLTPANQKALTRRIYDIANVLQSCGIIEKYNVGSTSETNKPGFRWSYQVSPEEMSKYLPEGHGDSLPLGVAAAMPHHNPWSVPMGPNPTLDDPAPEPLVEPLASEPLSALANPVELPPAGADSTEI